jgi:23S rRNA (adenine2503-C2)-methyltransferase
VRCELTPAALREWVVTRGMPAYRAGQVLRWVYQHGAVAFAEMSDLPAALRDQLESEFFIRQLRPAALTRAEDGTRKLLFRLDDGNAVESVLIPDPPRLTLCISSQAGCGMGCLFCATGRLGFRRNLVANEIVGQIIAARCELTPKERITNVVFMGMGEPLHNYDAVVAAIEILMASWGCGFSSRRITVSTVGLLPQLERLAHETPVNLAVSLVATNNEVRDRLMPVNRRYPIERLISVCRKLPIPQRRRITFEYVMLAGVNDTLDDANRLIRLLRGIPSKVNLIPFNPFPGAGFESSAPETMRAFQTRLLESGVNATVRISRGRDVQAACGQLAAAAA